MKRRRSVDQLLAGFSLCGIVNYLGVFIIEQLYSSLMFNRQRLTSCQSGVPRKMLLITLSMSNTRSKLRSFVLSTTAAATFPRRRGSPEPLLPMEIVRQTMIDRGNCQARENKCATQLSSS